MFNYRLWIFQASVIMVILVAVIMSNGNTLYFDAHYSQIIQSFRGDGLNTLVEGITYLGNWQSIVIICLLLFAFEKTRKNFGIPVIAVALVSSIANKLLKHYIARPRPDISNMLISEKGFSFPSGHTTTAVAVTVLIAYILIKLYKSKKNIIYSILLVCLGLLIGISRIYVGVHYPSDVFAGIFMGLGSFSLVSLFFYPYKKELLKWKKKFNDKIDKLDEVEAEIIDEE